MTPTMTQQPQSPFTVLEVAAQLRVHRNTVLRHLNEGHFPGAYRIETDRGMWRIPQSAMDAFIERGTPGSGE